MRYIHIFKTIVLGYLISVTLSACSDWLRVDPIDQVLEENVYDSEANINNALNGIYLQMAEGSLYGSELSGRTIEVLAQQYYISPQSERSDPAKYYMGQYNYTVDETKDLLANIWKRSYNTILNINNFIKNLENTQDVISQTKKNILLGEAYGLRAYMHLDLLRLYGPIYLTDSTNVSIPYRTKPEAGVHDRLPATEVMDNIISDLDRSISLLKDDPLVTYHPELASDIFYNIRNRRLNYYAVSALKVRALLYRNNKSAAGKLAKQMIMSDRISYIFPWINPEDFSRQNKEDRIFSSEVLFGIHSYNMYSYWNTYYSSGITSVITLYGGLKANLIQNFDLSGTSLDISPDYRAKNWKPYTEGEYMVTFKFSRSVELTEASYYQPLIRKSELFYALAECDNNIAYVDSVRLNRNLKTVSEAKPSWNFDTELQNEYIREFQGEGQLFYFYKRNNINLVRSGSSTGYFVLTDDEYVLPIPSAETNE
ncbi:MAG: RagB/SusD family nutrient uptake outer membrane protein [Dysgonomonas sp.]|nr:RagB/SusD family nutrient uptake outer membrane protein [Dysgonomonas sp.]